MYKKEEQRCRPSGAVWCYEFINLQTCRPSGLMYLAIFAYTEKGQVLNRAYQNGKETLIIQDLTPEFRHRGESCPRRKVIRTRELATSSVASPEIRPR